MLNINYKLVKNYRDLCHSDKLLSKIQCKSTQSQKESCEAKCILDTTLFESNRSTGLLPSKTSIRFTLYLYRSMLSMFIGYMTHDFNHNACFHRCSSISKF